MARPAAKEGRVAPRRQRGRPPDGAAARSAGVPAAGRRIGRACRRRCRAGRSRRSGPGFRRQATSTPASRSSSCSIVRGPRIADVTPGWAITKAIARCVSGSPASSASGMSCSTASSRRSSLMLASIPAAGCRVGWPLRYRPGQHALCHRAPYHHAHPVALADRQHLAFDAAAQDRVGRLLGAEPLPARAVPRPIAPRRSPRRESSRPIARTLPARIRSVRAERVSSISVSGTGGGSGRDRCGRSAGGAAMLDFADEPAPRIALLVRVIAHRALHLGGEHDVVAPPLERLADDLLGLPVL